jgi:hypothetical protein
MDERRVGRLLELLRERTPQEVTLGVMALAPALTPEMWRALELLRAERSGASKPGFGSCSQGVDAPYCFSRVSSKIKDAWKTGPLSVRTSIDI